MCLSERRQKTTNNPMHNKDQILKIVSEVMDNNEWIVDLANKDAFIEKLSLALDREEEKEIVICSAVIASDGSIFRGHRHHDALRALKDHGKSRADISAEFTEGFITSRNRFVGRKEAYEIQTKAGIPSALIGTRNEDGAYLHGRCFSEDLY